MEFATLTYQDLPVTGELQPEGWPDIVTDFKFYLDSEFCIPMKVVLEKRMVGIGAAIVLGDSAWIAHIIVDERFRKKGIGYSIVKELLNRLDTYSLKSYMLIATEMGKSLYEKAGFKAVSDYVYFRRETPWNDQKISTKVLPYETAYFSEVMDLDRKISGENRGSLLMGTLRTSEVYIRNNSVQGVYIPELGEGAIIADTRAAGIELMKIKYSVADKAVLPEENHAGISFLEQNGYVKIPKKGTRMVLGDAVKWQPEKIFSRIGGNLG